MAEIRRSTAMAVIEHRFLARQFAMRQQSNYDRPAGAKKWRGGTYLTTG
jgi:hypothetical protein